MEADKPNKIPCNTPNSHSDGPSTSNMIKNEKDDGNEDSNAKLATSLEKNLNNIDQQAKNNQVEESQQVYPNKSSDAQSNTKIVGNATADGRTENEATAVNQVGQLKTISDQSAVPVPISMTNQVPTTLSMPTTSSVVAPVPISVASSTPIRTSHVPVSISVLQAPYKRPTHGQLQGASKSPVAIAPLIKTTEVMSVPSASHTLAYFSEKVSVVKNLTTVSTVQALPNSTKTTSTIAPRNTKSRKLNYKFISTAAQKTPSSNGSVVMSPEPIKTSGFESNTQTSSANGGGGLTNLFKSGPKHAAKVVPDCFADKVKDSAYKCLGCGDSYNFQSSLDLHIKRCSSLIKYKCPFCNVTKHFYNKCSLFIHAREHARITKKPFELRANLANLSVLPTQDTNFFGKEDNKNETDNVKTPIQIVSTTSSSTQPSVNLKMDDRKTVDNKIDRSRDYLKDGMKMCLICMEKFTAHNTKAMHFKRETKRLVCEFCDQLLFNPCMAELHKNYHLHKQPLQCPDCGLVSATEKEAYQHIQQSCFHMSRKVLVRCSVCNIYVSSFKVYQNHLLDRHAESFYKCVECQLAYRSVETLKCHTVVEHKSSTISSMCNIILKCPLCETVFGNKKQLTAHIQSMHTYSDLSETKVVHECSHCGKLFQQLSSLDTHMMSTHKNCAGHFHCEFCNRALQFNDLASHKRHCSLKLQTKFKNSEGNVTMSKDTEVSTKSQTGECQDSGCSNSKKHPEGHKCLLCTKDGTNMGFKSKQDLDAHYLSLKHKEAVLKNAIEMATTSTAGTGAEERKRKADNQESVAPLKKLKIVVPKKDFKCALCDFTCPARADFKKHLVDKHDANGALQCHECGLSFRASLSHKMHLRAVHKIFALDQYFDEENTNVKEDACIEDKSENKTKLKTSPVTQIVKKFDSNLMECQVCYKVFDSEIDLRTHMRNHGMAFIKSKRKMSMDNKETN